MKLAQIFPSLSCARCMAAGAAARAIDHFSITLSSPAEKTAIWLQSHVLMGCCEPGVVRARREHRARRIWHIGRRERERERVHAACMHAQYTQLCAADTQGMCHPQLYNNAGGWCKFLARFPQDSRHIWCGGGGGARDSKRDAWNASSAIAALAPRAHGVVGILKF